MMKFKVLIFSITLVFALPLHAGFSDELRKASQKLKDLSNEMKQNSSQSSNPKHSGGSGYISDTQKQEIDSSNKLSEENFFTLLNKADSLFGTTQDYKYPTVDFVSLLGTYGYGYKQPVCHQVDILGVKVGTPIAEVGQKLGLELDTSNLTKSYNEDYVKPFENFTDKEKHMLQKVLAYVSDFAGVGDLFKTSVVAEGSNATGKYNFRSFRALTDGQFRVIGFNVTRVVDLKYTPNLNEMIHNKIMSHPGASVAKKGSHSNYTTSSYYLNGRGSFAEASFIIRTDSNPSTFTMSIECHDWMEKKQLAGKLKADLLNIARKVNDSRYKKIDIKL